MTGVTAILVLFLAPQAPGAQPPAPAPAPVAPVAGPAAVQGALFGGVPAGTANATPLPLSPGEAIARALKQNLALVPAEQGVRQARGTQEEARADVLPHLFGRASAVRQKINLQAFGFSGFPGIDNPVIGPFNVFDARLFVTEDFNLKDYQEARSESRRVDAARWTYQDTRELVVLVT